MVETSMVEVPQDVEGEADALCKGVNAAVRMMRATGCVKPTAIALVRNGSGWSGLWEMDVTQAVLRGNDGMSELGLVLGKLVSREGCDLSSMGVRPDHFKADAVLFVAEGRAQSESQGAVAEVWRSVTVEMRTEAHCCGLLYRVVEGNGEVRLDFVGRVSGQASPLMQAPAQIH